MSITSGCSISESHAYCALGNYLSDVSAMCSLGLVWNAAYNTRICAIALTVFSALKLSASVKNSFFVSKKSNEVNKCGAIQQWLNVALFILGGLTTLAAGLSKNNAAWIRQMWNDEISNCANDKRRFDRVQATPSPSCMANPSWNIIYSENVTCCFSQKLEEEWKSTHTPMLPVIFAVASLGLIFFMSIGDCIFNASLPEPETQPLNATVKPVSSTRLVVAVCNVVMAVLLLGTVLGTTVASFSYNYCLPDWVNQDLNMCICSSPR